MNIYTISLLFYYQKNISKVITNINLLCLLVSGTFTSTTDLLGWSPRFISVFMRMYCSRHPHAILEHATECNHYYNCSKATNSMKMVDHLEECRYPDLFSAKTLTCENFTTVSCDKRTEPRAPCKFPSELFSLLPHHL